MTAGERMLRVLLVVTDVVQALRERRALHQARVSVVVVHRGADALAWIDTEPVDLVVVDHHLPDMSGLQMLAALREHVPAVPVILAAAPTSNGLALAALKAGAADCLVNDGDPEFPHKLLRCVTDVHARFWRSARAREARSRVFAYSVPDSWCCTWGDGEVVGCGASHPRALFAHADGLIGRTLADLLPPEVAQVWQATIRAARAPGAARTFASGLGAPGPSREYEGRILRTGRDEVHTFLRVAIDRTWVEARRARLMREVSAATTASPIPGPRFCRDGHG